MRNSEQVRKNLRLIREKYNYSQNHVAKKIGMEQKSYSRMEAGETKDIKDEYIQKLSELYPEEGENLKDFLESEAKFIVNQTNRDRATGYAGYTYQNTLTDQERESYEKHILHLEGEIGFLRELLKPKTA